ncbi:beta-ketoacyl-[acyl-carrier-protein] synthase family protein [Streptomyces zagrosensis]|uniref:3-oxoacyl-[acyl-carrier-protein] synthase II n=1 Tax=Streptomyces zagrosensis TaxID=1042984 RepID=A0A7W9V3C7_9ACTN|nr:beta-ketoacyl-[acyl-carrier-protein] synthase family protein [Streptomyces zagrosensis]MBB5940171.1 3-oxoacyl-[acyl-carrier-protein] synthase II [Streptomyces zagrosensis]
MTDVVITGLGVVSPLGHTLEDYWNGLLRGDVPIRPLDYPGTAIHGSLTYLVEDAPAVAADLGRASGFAVAAARSAFADAGLAGAPQEVLDGVGVCVGTGNGDSDLREQERDGLRELTGVQWYPFGTAAIVASALDLHGPGGTVSTACAAGAYAVSFGVEMITSGEADLVLVGGAEAVSRPAIGAFLRLGAADKLHCRPFDAERGGTVYGEGAAFLVLESAEHAAQRGQRPYAKVLGAGWSCDASHVTAPDVSGEQADRAAREALARGGITEQAIGAVLSHGTGTPANDSTESRTTARVLAQRTPDVPVAAIKASLGHSGGAAGAFSCVTAALVVRHQLVPPVGTLRQTDPECELRLVRDVPQATAGDAVLVNAYAFGGNNITVAIGAAEPLSSATAESAATAVTAVTSGSGATSGIAVTSGVTR